MNEFCCGKNLELFSPSSASSTLSSPLLRLFLLCEVRLSPSLTGFQRHACNACSSTSVLLTFLPIQRNAAPLCSPLFSSLPHLSCELSPPPSPHTPHSPSYYSLFSPSAALILRIKESHFIEEGEPAVHFSLFLLFLFLQLALISI